MHMVQFVNSYCCRYVEAVQYIRMLLKEMISKFLQNNMINTNVEVYNASNSGFSQDKCYLPLINKMARFWSRPLSLLSPVFLSELETGLCFQGKERILVFQQLYFIGFLIFKCTAFDRLTTKIC